MGTFLRSQQPRGRRHKTPASEPVTFTGRDATPAEPTVLIREPDEPSHPGTMAWPQTPGPCDLDAALEAASGELLDHVREHAAPWNTPLASVILNQAPAEWADGEDAALAALSFVEHLLREVDRLGGSLRPPWCQPAKRGTYGVLPELLNDRPDLAYVLNPKAPVPAPVGMGEGGSGEGGTPAHSGLAGTPSPETAEKSSGPASGPPSDTGPDSGTEGEPESEEDCAEDGGAA